MVSENLKHSDQVVWTNFMVLLVLFVPDHFRCMEKSSVVVKTSSFKSRSRPDSIGVKTKTKRESSQDKSQFRQCKLCS